MAFQATKSVLSLRGFTMSYRQSPLCGLFANSGPAAAPKDSVREGSQCQVRVEWFEEPEFCREAILEGFSRGRTSIKKRPRFGV